MADDEEGPFADDEDDYPGAVEADPAAGSEEAEWVQGAEESAPAFRLVLQLRSNADPSLIVDAAALWSQPETVLSRFGSQAEADLLLALRRGAAIWPPLAEVLQQASPSVIDLDDDALTSLLGPAAEELAGAGIEVLWPSSMLGDGLKLRAVPTPTPEKLTDAGFGLAALLDFHWQLTLDGAMLDADEIAALAEAKRPLIRLRGRWVILDPALLDRLRRPPRTRMRASEALGAVLAGTAEIDGETVTVVAEGPLADLAARVAGIAAAPVPLAPPPGLKATLRPYQQRGLAWLAGMCDTGLGGCLADDMGLGKTIQVIALHLHRRDNKAGPTLVVCPASRSAPGSTRCDGSPLKSPSAGTTEAGATCRTWPPTRSSWSPTEWCCVTRHAWPRPAGAWSSPTRRSTPRTRCRGPRASCGRCPRPPGSR